MPQAYEHTRTHARTHARARTHTHTHTHTHQAVKPIPGHCFHKPRSLRPGASLCIIAGLMSLRRQPQPGDGGGSTSRLIRAVPPARRPPSPGSHPSHPPGFDTSSEPSIVGLFAGPQLAPMPGRSAASAAESFPWATFGLGRKQPWSRKTTPDSEERPQGRATRSSRNINPKRRVAAVAGEREVGLGKGTDGR